MILGPVLLSLTLVTLGAYWLANEIDRRTHEREVGPEVKIYPYAFPGTESKCPFCGVYAEKKADGKGPGAPVACKQGEECPGFGRSHLHVSCRYCQASWLQEAESP